MTNLNYDLGYAIINFETETITWKPSEFTPKRRNLILSYFKKGYINYSQK